MTKLIIRRAGIKLIILITLFLSSGCLSLKTISTDSINKLQSQRKYLQIHAADSLWVIEQYKVENTFLTGEIVRNVSNVNSLRKADIYIPASNDVNIDGALLSVSTENIGKVDYKFADASVIISSISIFLVFIVYVPLMLIF